MHGTTNHERKLTNSVEDIIRTIQQETTMPCILVRKKILSATEITFKKYAGSLENCEGLLERYNQLSPYSQERIIKSPATYYALIQQSKFSKVKPEVNFLPFFNAAINIEASLEGRNIYFDRPSWSALGDIYVPDGDWDLSNLHPEFSEFNPDKIYFSRTIHKIVIDGYSPMVTNDHRPGGNSYLPLSFLKNYPEEQYKTILPLLDEALHTIKEKAKVFYFLILSNVPVIQIAKKEGTGLSSQSLNTQIGLMTIYNAHRKTLNAGHIISTMVHEAIHSFIFSFEHQNPIVLYRENRNAAPLISPWTNAKLTLHNYVHACFVWWGLCNFWESVIDHLPTSIPYDTALANMKNAQKGFLTDKVINNLYPYKEEINPDFFYWLEKIPAGPHINTGLNKWA